MDDYKAGCGGAVDPREKSQDIMWGIVVNDHCSHYTGLKPLKHSSSHTDLLSST